MPNLNEIYQRQIFRGSPAYGNSDVKEVLGDKIAEEQLKSGDFVTIGSENGLVKKVSNASDKVIGMVIARIHSIVGADSISETSSSNVNYVNAVYNAKTMIPYIKVGYKIRLLTLVDVDAGDEVYIDVSTGHLTNVSTNNIKLGNSVFEESADAGNFVDISFNLL